MKYKFVVYAEVFDSIGEISRELSKNLKEFVGEDYKVYLGFKIGILTIVSNMDRFEVRKMLNQRLNGIFKGKVWVG